MPSPESLKLENYYIKKKLSVIKENCNFHREKMVTRVPLIAKMFYTFQKLLNTDMSCLKLKIDAVNSSSQNCMLSRVSSATVPQTSCNGINIFHKIDKF